MTTLYHFFAAKWLTPPHRTSTPYTSQTIIVTGATSGIGIEAAYQFAALGADTVILAARDVQKGLSTKAQLAARLGRDDQLHVWPLDLMSYDSVCAFARRAQGLARLDVAVLNAGTRRARYGVSGHGWEEDLQVNTLSSVLLGVLLLPKLKEGRRVTGRAGVLEFVNSGLHQGAVVPVEVRRGSVLGYYNDAGRFGEGAQYKFSKVFLMYATNMLAGMVSSGDVVITSVCPGMVRSDLGRDHYFPGVWVLAVVLVVLFMKTPGQGADAVLSGTTQGEVVHGRFWKDDRVMPVPVSVRGSEMRELGEKVWGEIVEELGRVEGFRDALGRL